MEEFSKHEKFMIRIHTVFILSKMAEHLEAEVVDEIYVQFGLPLCKDPVPNIRFNVAKLTTTVWHKLNEETKSRA